MTMIKYTIPLIVLILLSCNKFEHEEVNVESPCVLCDWAEDQEGIYSGVMTNHIQTSVQDSISTDSLYVEIEHVFINANPYHDSTVMYLQLKAYKDSISNPNPLVYLITATDSLGPHSSSYYGVDFYGDSLSLIHSIASSSPSWYVYSEIGTLYR